jgi:O-antigen/teichoic acid export membrane protein
MALVSFNINVPRYFIEYHLGTAQLGIFAAMAYPMVAGGTIVGALGQSATPRLSLYYASGERRAFLSLLLKLVGLASAVGLAAVLVIALAGRPILLLLYRPEYAEHVTAFLLLAIATALGYVASILGYGMTAARYFRAQLPVFMLTTAVTAAACALLVPRHQLAGAALAMSLATLCQGAASAAVIVHALKNGRIK